jgi:hypothetical protein
MGITNTLQVTRVRGEVLYSHSHARNAAGPPPAIMSYRYTVVLEDGSEEVIRAGSTHLYAWVYQWAAPVESRQRGLAAYFTLSVARLPPREALTEFGIKWLD